MAEPVKFRGVVTYQRYYNEDSFWGVFNVRIKDKLPFSQEINNPNVFEDDEGFEPYYVICVAGKMQQLYVGSEYEFTAICEYNSKYKSWNYVPSTVTALAPSSIESSRLFLSSIINESQANVLLKEYPNIIQEIIDGKDNVKIDKLFGIGEKTYKRIRNKIIDNYVISDIITLLQPYGVTFAAIRSLLKWEPNSSILKQKIKENPYVLTNAKGFGFQTVDRLALKIQPELINSGKRLIAFMKYTLGKAADESGHTWVTFSDLNNDIIDQIPQCKDLFDNLVEQNQDGKFAGYFFIKDKKIGLSKYYDCENAIYDILKVLEEYDFNGKIDVDNGIAKAENELGYELSEDQRNVVRQVTKNNVVIYGGYSGAGKTSVARAILNSFPTSSIACCSLSAKAAQRIQEATGFHASTAHRLLGYSHTGFTYDSKNRLPYDIVFIDEASMLNCTLFYNIVSAVKEGAKIVICGDYAQLPPIGAGNVFSDLIHMPEDFNISILSKVHRQAEKSGILTDANKIRKGIFPIEEPRPQIISGELKDMAYVFRDNRERIQDIAVSQFIKIVNSKGLDNVVCIVPRKDTVVNSSLEINKQIQSQLIDTKNTPYIQGLQNKFYIGDRILQIENDSERDIFNGEVGFVEEVYPNAKNDETIMVARFKSTLNGEDKIVEYSRDDLKTVLLGYSMSIHKSQGSEYDYVITVIDNTHFTLLDNCLLYTAITRAKKMSILIAQPEAFKRAMKNNFNRNRQTWLGLRIKN